MKWHDTIFQEQYSCLQHSDFIIQSSRFDKRRGFVILLLICEKINISENIPKTYIYISLATDISSYLLYIVSS